MFGLRKRLYLGATEGLTLTAVCWRAAAQQWAQDLAAAAQNRLAAMYNLPFQNNIYGSIGMRSCARLLAAAASVAWCGDAFAQTNSLPPSSGSPAPQMAQGLPPLNAAPTPAPGQSGDELTEINKKLLNPVSTTWSLIFQQNNYGITLPEGQVGHQNNLLFQPVLPVAVTNDWNLISRPVLPLFNSVPTVDAQGNLGRATGFGDMGLVEFLSPSTNLVGPNWILGAGPTFIAPTASNGKVGQGKWQIGPSAILGYLGDKFILAVFPQQWWSVGGYGSQNVSQLDLQYAAAYLPGDGWSIESSPNILVNWNATSGEKVTFPVGLGIGKVVKFGPLPVKFTLQVQYMPARPDLFGQKWNVQLRINPVIPKLIKGVLFDE